MEEVADGVVLVRGTGLVVRVVQEALEAGVARRPVPARAEAGRLIVVARLGGPVVDLDNAAGIVHVAGEVLR